MKTNEELIQSLTATGYLKTLRIVEAFRAIDRAKFVEARYRDKAYENYPLPIAGNQTISQPLTVAFMLELLDPKPGEKILDIGAGSGWQTSLLAHIATGEGKKGRVIAIERLGVLCTYAKKNIEKYGFISNKTVAFFCRDGSIGAPEEAPFDKIIAAASIFRKEDLPRVWREELGLGGKLITPIGESIWMFQKLGEQKWKESEFPGFVFVPFVKGEGSISSS